MFVVSTKFSNVTESYIYIYPDADHLRPFVSATQYERSVARPEVNYTGPVWLQCNTNYARQHFKSELR